MAEGNSMLLHPLSPSVLVGDDAAFRYACTVRCSLVAALWVASLGGVAEAQTQTAARSPSPLTVDGVLGEAAWATASPVTFRDPGGVSDNEVTVRMLWTPTHLWVSYEVVDALIRDEPGTPPWQDDGADFWVETGFDRSDSARLDYHVIVDTAGDRILKRGDGADLVSSLGVEAATMTRGTGYVLEMSVSFEDMGFTPSVGAKLGLFLGASDLDDADYRQFGWTDLRPFEQPTQWGELELAPAPQLPDAGMADAGMGDAGMVDSGTADAGAEADASPARDAAVRPPDAQVGGDSGALDAGVPGGADAGGPRSDSAAEGAALDLHGAGLLCAAGGPPSQVVGWLLMLVLWGAVVRRRR